MSRVLIVDDEPRYRDYLGRFLTQRRHETAAAAGGREAIALGGRFRPELLVADWMLRDQVHGLQVQEALRLLNPDLRSVLITGFPSEDLALAARERPGLVVLAKPFGFEQLAAAVEEALARAPAPPLPIAILELGAEGIVPLNPAAHALLRLGAALAEPVAPPAALGPNAAARVEEATGRWIAVRPPAERTPWLLRAQPAGGAAGRLLALVPPSEPVSRWAEPVRLLLGLRDPEERRWPFSGRLLLIDPDPLQRRRQAERLEHAGATCYAAADTRQALRLFEHDEAIAFVVADCASLAVDGAAFVARVRELDRDALLIGTGAPGAGVACEQAGLIRFLPRPWGLEELLSAVET